MEFPAELRGEVERLLSEENTDKLAKAAEGISARYRGNDGSGKRLVSSRRDILAYSAVRMPATFGAVSSGQCWISARVRALPRTRRISRLTAGSSPA